MQAILALLLALVPLGATSPDQSPYPGGFFGQAETTVVSAENFRFCSRACRADSMAYVRTPAGPVPGTDNPRAVVYMQAGAPLTWAYRDRGCDLLRCTGHDIRIEDGTAGGRRVGELTAETGHDTVDWRIPADAESESIIRYFCARHASIGMTGAFQVLPISLLSVSYPQVP
jgi:hypothetical protein